MMRAAVVGLGWWGKTMVGMLRASDRLKVVLGIDTDPVAGDWARGQGLAFAAELEAALADPAVDAVILCTPHSRHTAQIARAAKAGKHVFCEKPLALKRNEAAQSVALCNAAKVVLGIGHERRFEPPMRELRRLVDSGELGRLLQIEASFCQNKLMHLPADNWRRSVVEAPAGPMTATGIHLIDLAVSFFGPADSALCRSRQLGSNFANGDTLAVLVTFKNGGVALINAILATPFAGRFTLYGDKGWAEIRDLSHPEKPEGWVLTRCDVSSRTTTQDFPPAPSVRMNLEAFADAVAGRAPYPMPQAEMIANIAALEAILSSAASGAIVSVS